MIKNKFSGRFAEEMNWWLEQPEPKPSKQRFQGRLLCWYKKEDAILTESNWLKVKKKAGRTWLEKFYTPTYSSQRKQDVKSPVEINITYPNEIANVFRKEFSRIIDKIEWKIYWVEDRECIKELYTKLDLAKVELELFNLYNPIE